MQLSKREINIMLTLIDTAAPVTTASLAEQFNRSVRSIKYDLDNLRTWLKMKELTIRTRRNKGIWIEWSESTKLAIKNELLHVERNDLYPDQTNRIYRLILWLSLADTPLTSNEMAEALKVSRNTIIADLDKMDFLLLKYAVTLDRKNHYGFKLVGDEANVRHLMEAVIQKSLTDYDVYYLMQIVVNQEDSNPTNTYGMPPKMAAVFNETLQAIAKLMDKEMLDKFNYSELLAIILRVCIATIRLKNNRTINSYRILSQQTMHEIKAELPFLLMKKVFYHYQFPFLEDEYIYIFSDVLTSKKDENIAELTTALIDEVSEKEQLPFNKDKQLFNNLFAHLSLRLHKKHVFVNEYNPFVDDIKSKYAKLFRHIKVVSERQIDDATIFVNDSFISYIALHFLVAYEKNKAA
ncbi:BglG family transcription antiterminator [Brochothrix campestris]|uniref:BglG family transcription antiterminator n=1 Tax=Brochothrix campestris TaxID=2757 RepID=UPI0004ADBFB7|nr:HTH domain-containing protein [Brochothrix campestris]